LRGKLAFVVKMELMFDVVCCLSSFFVAGNLTSASLGDGSDVLASGMNFAQLVILRH
jgi:hypothetical protein